MKLISKALRMARVKGITQLYLSPTRLSTNGMSHPAFTPSCRASLHFDRYSLPVPQRVRGWVGLGGWFKGKSPWSRGYGMVPHEAKNNLKTKRAILLFGFDYRYYWPAYWASIVLFTDICHLLFVVCNASDGRVGRPAAGRVGGRATDTARRASTVTFR